MQFLAIVGSHANTAIAYAGMSEICRADDLVVLGSPEVKFATWNDFILIGTVFPTFDESYSQYDGVSFHHLTATRWGTYVALRLGKSGMGAEVLADPSAMLPCYYCSAQGAIVLGSDAATVLHTAGHRIAIDWEQVGLQLLRRDWRTTRCSISGLREVPAGAAVRVGSPDEVAEQVWTPKKYLRGRPLKDFDGGAVSIRSLIDRCAASLCADGNLSLIGISGGLDSSIVAASMATAGAPVSFFTMFFEESDADEREFARMVASHFGAKLWERPYLVDDVDLEVSSVSRLPRPVGWIFQQSIDKASGEIMQAAGASRIVRGTGGDAVFCYNNSAAPIIDALIDKGLPEAWRTTIDLCRLTGASIPQSLKAAWPMLRSRRSPRNRIDRSFISEAIMDHPELALRHPWLDDCLELPPGRQRQIDMLCSPHNLIETRLALETEVVCPLLSQPVMEAALTIPSWQWMSGGINRSVARAAYADALPTAILQRSTKGGPTTFASLVYKRNRRRIREMLLDGRLATNGILDRSAVEQATRQSSADAPRDLARLMALADAESWSAHWERRATT